MDHNHPSVFAGDSLQNSPITTPQMPKFMDAGVFYVIWVQDWSVA
jgi:hypothetical protein